MDWDGQYSQSGIPNLASEDAFVAFLNTFKYLMMWVAGHMHHYAAYKLGVRQNGGN